MTVDIRAWHLHGADSVSETAVVAERDGVRVIAPVLSTDDIHAVCRRLIAARERLHSVPVARVVSAADTAARRLLDPAEPARAEALAALTAISGYSAAMAAHLLDRAAQDWLQPELDRLVDVELGGAAAIEDFLYRAPGIRSRAVAPALGLHVFSGNVPGISVTSIIRALLVRSAVFGKSAAGEPVLGPLFARLLAAADPDVGACVAATWWPGGDESREAAVLSHAGLVVHYGSEAAIASLRERVASLPGRIDRPGIRLVEHGPRISFAIINAAAAGNDQTAADLATAVALFDQQGCVSPQIAWVIGSEVDAAAFAGAVAEHLRRIEESLPRGRLEREEATAVRDLRTRAEFAAIAGHDIVTWEGRDLAFTVIFSAAASFEGSCLNRTLLVRNAATTDDVLDRARPFAALLQTVGVAGFTGPERLDLAARLAGIGVSRVTPLAAMPWPPAAWHHDGRGPLVELVRWIDLEESEVHVGPDSRNTSSI